MPDRKIKSNGFQPFHVGGKISSFIMCKFLSSNVRVVRNSQLLSKNVSRLLVIRFGKHFVLIVNGKRNCSSSLIFQLFNYLQDRYRLTCAVTDFIRLSQPHSLSLTYISKNHMQMSLEGFVPLIIPFFKGRL